MRTDTLPLPRSALSLSGERLGLYLFLLDLQAARGVGEVIDLAEVEQGWPAAGPGPTRRARRPHWYAQELRALEQAGLLARVPAGVQLRLAPEPVRAEVRLVLEALAELHHDLLSAGLSQRIADALGRVAPSEPAAPRSQAEVDEGQASALAEVAASLGCEPTLPHIAAAIGSLGRKIVEMQREIARLTTAPGAPLPRREAPAAVAAPSAQTLLEDAPLSVTTQTRWPAPAGPVRLGPDPQRGLGWIRPDDNAPCFLGGSEASSDSVAPGRWLDRICLGCQQPLSAHHDGLAYRCEPAPASGSADKRSAGVPAARPQERWLTIPELFEPPDRSSVPVPAAFLRELERLLPARQGGEEGGENV